MRRLHFVVQRHKATRLHYDLRLEMGGTLKSWAVPRGPSMNPDDKRLAVQTPDHPMLYRFYRGIVPGPVGGIKKRLAWRIVEIWDRGFYNAAVLPKKMSEEKYLLSSLKKGIIKFTLHGQKLKGTFLLLKIKNENLKSWMRGTEWLLIKQKDKYAVDEAYNSEKLTRQSSLINYFLRREKRKQNWLYREP